MAGIRPKEIYGLQVKDIDWFNQCFTVSATDERSKSREARKVPIPNTLVPLIKQLELDMCMPNDYIFSKDMRPGAKRVKRDCATKLWQTLIKEGLKLDVSLYSFKGLGGEKKRLAGIDKQAVSTQYGHHSLLMTDVYLHREDERSRRVIIERTPDF